jgi:hypothetical protein
MFDEYIPDPPLNCPACGKELQGWQGKDGPNALLVWKQGQAAPVDQAIEDGTIRLEPENLAAFRLPEEFFIYTQCCARFFVEADCTCERETWTHITPTTAENATQHKQEKRGEFKARLRWLSPQNSQMT